MKDVFVTIDESINDVVVIDMGEASEFVTIDAEAGDAITLDTMDAIAIDCDVIDVFSDISEDLSMIA
jgi:hypothetical protein